MEPREMEKSGAITVDQTKPWAAPSQVDETRRLSHIWKSSCVDIKVASAAALQSLPHPLRDWLPGGRRQGHEYVVRNPTRSDGRPGSFSINTASGRWSDFATGDNGGDAVALFAYLNRMSQVEAARAVADRLGLYRPEQTANDDPVPGANAPVERKAGGYAEPDRDSWTAIVPIPEAEFAPLDIRLGGREPNKTWLFADAAGQPLGFECRWIKANGKVRHLKREALVLRGPIEGAPWRVAGLAVRPPGE